MKTSVQIDWLSFSCKIETFANSDFIVIKENYQTKEFASVYTVYYNNEEFCIVTADPRSPILHKNLCIVKLINFHLYTSMFYSNLKYFISTYNVVDIKINRLDLCVDFQQFDNNLLPEQLIRRFVNETYIHKGKAKFKVIGSNTKKIEFEYLSFGAGTSNVQVKLYNKTKELQQVKDKTWIRKTWEQLDFKENMDIWRLEFCIKHLNQKFLNMDTGEIHIIDLSILGDQTLLNSLFYSHYIKYFQFLINSTDTNKSRLKKVNLFNNSFDNIHRLNLDNAVKSNRMDKYFLSRLEHLFSELRLNREDKARQIESIKQDFIEKKELTQYYFKSVLPHAKSIEDKPDYMGKEIKILIRKEKARKRDYNNDRTLEFLM